MQETISSNKVSEVVEADQAPKLKQTARERAPHLETATTWEALCQTGEIAKDVADINPIMEAKAFQYK